MLAKIHKLPMQDGKPQPEWMNRPLKYAAAIVIGALLTTTILLFIDYIHGLSAQFAFVAAPIIERQIPDENAPQRLLRHLQEIPWIKAIANSACVALVILVAVYWCVAALLLWRDQKTMRRRRLPASLLDPECLPK